jgi:hypothetical protein
MSVGGRGGQAGQCTDAGEQSGAQGIAKHDVSLLISGEHCTHADTRGLAETDPRFKPGAILGLIRARGAGRRFYPAVNRSLPNL